MVLRLGDLRTIKSAKQVMACFEGAIQVHVVAYTILHPLAVLDTEHRTIALIREAGHSIPTFILISCFPCCRGLMAVWLHRTPPAKIPRRLLPPPIIITTLIKVSLLYANPQSTGIFSLKFDHLCELRPESSAGPIHFDSYDPTYYLTVSRMHRHPCP